MFHSLKKYLRSSLTSRLWLALPCLFECVEADAWSRSRHILASVVEFFSLRGCVFGLSGWYTHRAWRTGFPFSPNYSHVWQETSALWLFLFSAASSLGCCRSGAVSCGGAAPWESQHRCHSPGCDPSCFKVAQHRSRAVKVEWRKCNSARCQPWGKTR